MLKPWLFSHQDSPENSQIFISFNHGFKIVSIIIKSRKFTYTYINKLTITYLKITNHFKISSFDTLNKSEHKLVSAEISDYTINSLKRENLFESKSYVVIDQRKDPLVNLRSQNHNQNNDQYLEPRLN